MKKLLLLLSISIGTIFSQDEIPDLNNKFALQFQVGSIISLRDFQGLTFSGKYHFTTCLAVRFGVGASLYNSDGDGYDAMESENFKEYYFTSEVSERVIAVRTQIIHYFSLFNDFALFAGGGPFYSKTKRDYVQKFTDTSRVDNLDKLESNEYGADLIFGAEWFVNKNIGISGEYGFGVSIGNRKQTYEYSYRKSNSESDIFIIYPSQVRLGLSVYF